MIASTAVEDESTESLGPAIPSGPRFGAKLLALWAVGLVAACAWGQFDERAMFLVFGWSACLIVTLPLLGRRYDLISPWSFIVLAVYIGCGLRSWFVAFNIDGNRRTIDDLFLLHRPVTYFFWPSVLFVVAVAVMTAGFMLSSKPVAPQEGRGRGYEFGQLAPFVVFACAALGAVAFYLFVQRTGGIDLTTLSAKRARLDGLDLTDYQSHGQLRALCDFSSYAYWIATAMFASSGKRHGLASARGMVLAALFVNAAALPIYASSRADAAYILIIGAAIELCLNRNRVRVGPVILGGAVAVAALISILTLLRAGSGAAEVDTSAAGTVGETFIYNRNFTDIPTSAQIIRAVPQQIAPAHGSTYAAWLTAAIPRRYWPDKPLISSGPILGVHVFHTTGSGVRPGFIAEAYWNFGVGGTLLMCAIFGVALRRIYETGRPRLTSPFAVIMYAAVFMRLGSSVFSVGLGYAVFGALVTAAALGFVLTIARGRTGPLRPRGSGSARTLL